VALLRQYCEHHRGDSRRRAARRGAGRQTGAVLLEVVLALALFVMAATIITGGLTAAINEVKRLRLAAHASNLAATVVAQIQMGVQPGEAAGPAPFEPPFDQWKWETIVSPVNDTVGATNPIQKVEVIIRHNTESIVYRVTQFLPVSGGGSTPATPGAGTATSAGGNG
jgi:type II secretory pathway pseudopilin PulG